LSKNSYLLGANMMDGTHDAYDYKDEFHPLLRDRPSHAMVFQNALIYLCNVGVVTNISHGIDRQPILEWDNSSGLLSLSPCYELTDIFNISAISQSTQPRIDDNEIVRTIGEVRDFYGNITQFNRKFESRIFYTSLAKLLPPDNLGIVLDEASVRELVACGLFPHREGSIYNAIVQAGIPSEFPVQIRNLWKDGPLFCLINDEARGTTYLFCTLHFPEIL
jgi:hypothetical protein